MKYLNKVLELFDCLLEQLWRLFCACCGIIWRLLCFLGRGAVLLWKKVRDRNGFMRFIDYILRGLEYVLILIFFLPVKLVSMLKKKLDGSKCARRMVCLLCLLLLAIAWEPFQGIWYAHYRWRRFESGIASWYGPGFYFRRTKSGDLFLPGLYLTAAHKTLPMGTKVLVVNEQNGQEIVVRINDRGPFVAGRVIDLSWFAAWRLGITEKGTVKVVLYVPTSMKKLERDAKQSIKERK